MEVGFSNFMGQQNHWLSFSESHVTTWHLWFSTSEPHICFQSPGFPATDSKRKPKQLQHPCCSHYRNKKWLRKSATLPYNRGPFSRGNESMTQSKITVGNKKYCFSHQDYIMIYYILWDIFPGTAFHGWTKSIFWRIIPKGTYST